MGVLDIILLCLFLPALWVGISKGLVLQITSLVAVLVGIWASRRFSPPVADWTLAQFGGNPQVISILCYVGVFLLAALLLGLLGRLVTKAVKTASLGWINRLFGLLFAIGTTALVLGMCISLFEGLNAQWQLADPQTLQASRVWGILRDTAAWIFPHLKDFFSSFAAPSGGQESGASTAVQALSCLVLSRK